MDISVEHFPFNHNEPKNLKIMDRKVSWKNQNYVNLALICGFLVDVHANYTSIIA